MFHTLKKLLYSQGGWMAAIPAATSLITSILGMTKSKGKFNQTGEEKNLANATTAMFPARQRAYDIADQAQANLDQSLASANAGGLQSAISEAFSQRPNSAELNSIAGQERQLKNQALNSGAKGGLLRQQMFEAGKNAATNKMNVMENARQNALQRAFQIFQGQAPSQASQNANRSQAFNMENLINSNWTNLAKLGVERNLAQSAANERGASSAGGGLGSIFGSLFGGGDTSSGGGLLGSLFPSLLGSITGQTNTNNPSFSLPTNNQVTFPQVPFTRTNPDEWLSYN